MATNRFHAANRGRNGSRTLGLLLLLACITQGGCVQRRFTIRSNPPGARVFVDKYEIGTTPVSHDFIYYGTREIRLVKDGYETLVVNQPIPAPWYEYPGLDFVSENLVPTEIRDNRVLEYQLSPQVVVPTEQLVGRAEELRRARNPQATGPSALPGVAPALPSGGTPPVMAPGSAPAPPLAQPGVVAPPAQPGLMPAQPGFVPGQPGFLPPASGNVAPPAGSPTGLPPTQF